MTVMPSVWSAAIPVGPAENVGFSFTSVTVMVTVTVGALASPAESVAVTVTTYVLLPCRLSPPASRSPASALGSLSGRSSGRSRNWRCRPQSCSSARRRQRPWP